MMWLSPASGPVSACQRTRYAADCMNASFLLCFLVDSPAYAGEILCALYSLSDRLTICNEVNHLGGIYVCALHCACMGSGCRLSLPDQLLRLQSLPQRVRCFVYVKGMVECMGWGLRKGDLKKKNDRKSADNGGLCSSVFPV